VIKINKLPFGISAFGISQYQDGGDVRQHISLTFEHGHVILFSRFRALNPRCLGRSTFETPALWVNDLLSHFITHFKSDLFLLFCFQV
jgi:hypothetical protein